MMFRKIFIHLGSLFLLFTTLVLGFLFFISVIEVTQGDFTEWTRLAIVGIVFLVSTFLMFKIPQAREWLLGIFAAIWP